MHILYAFSQFHRNRTICCFSRIYSTRSECAISQKIFLLQRQRREKGSMHIFNSFLPQSIKREVSLCKSNSAYTVRTLYNRTRDKQRIRYFLFFEGSNELQIISVRKYLCEENWPVEVSASNIVCFLASQQGVLHLIFKFFNEALLSFFLSFGINNSIYCAFQNCPSPSNAEIPQCFQTEARPHKIFYECGFLLLIFICVFFDMGFTCISSFHYLNIQVYNLNIFRHFNSNFSQLHCETTTLCACTMYNVTMYDVIASMRLLSS